MDRLAKAVIAEFKKSFEAESQKPLNEGCDLWTNRSGKIFIT